MKAKQPPNHNYFEFGSIIFDSQFDSGNLAHVEKVGGLNFSLWIGPDHTSHPYRTWFHFKVKAYDYLTFNIKNMGNQYRLFSEGFVPVFKTN